VKISSLIIAFVCGMLFPYQAIRVSAQVEPPHPILTISGSGSGASTVLSTWTESQYTNNFVPHLAPRNSAYGFAPAVVPGDTGWSWSASTPNQITSTPSGTVFPNANPAYPVITQAVTVFLTTATNNLTQTVNAPYYNQAGSTTAKSLVFNLINYKKQNQLRSDLNKLAPAYINSGATPSTRTDTYARRIAVALLDWARWHPSYVMTAINSPAFVNVTPNYQMPLVLGSFGLPRASEHNGLTYEWQNDELKAFDAIYDSTALTNLSVEFGFDVRKYICDNLFFDEGDFLVNHVPVDVAIQSNLSASFAVLPNVARVLNRPDYLYWMDAYNEATVRKKIRRDGQLEEGLAYSIGYLNANVTGVQNTADYFLTRAATNAALLAISNNASVYLKTLTYGQAQMNSVSWPNGQLPSFGDTPFVTYFSAHPNGLSGLLPAYGHVSMGAGSGSQAVQVNQSFTGNNNHMRSDMTALNLWAFNNPYLENIRYYNGTPGRMFGEQLLAHNAVTIDRVDLTPFPNADTYGNAGDLMLYEPGNNGLALTEIDGQRGYSNKAMRYQRLMLLNSVDPVKPYVVDVLRVTGGTNHDYTFHGAIRWDQTWECSFPLVTNNSTYPMLEGETWFEPPDQYASFPYYGFWRGVSSNAAPQSNFQITYRDTNRGTARDTRLWMTDDGTSKVYLGMTPNPGRNDTVPANFYVYWRPSAIIRHRIPSGTLSDLFVSVIEPMNAGVSNIVSVTRLPMSGTTNESVGLKITFTDGRVDTYIVNLRNPQVAGANVGSATVATADGHYSLTGRVGLQVDRTSGDSRVWTMNATDFKYPGRRLTTPNTYFSGAIAGETRKATGGSYDAFTTASPLPTGTALRNQFLSFTYGALSSGQTGISEMFKIDQVVFTNGLYSICFTNDHEFEITNGITSVEQVAPRRSFSTSNSFELAVSASAQQLSPIADQIIPPGGSSGALSFNFGNLGATPGSALQVSAASTNQTLIPNANLVIGGSGTNRTLTITPVIGQTGSSLVTVSVTDGVWTNSRSFTATVGSFGLVASPASQTVLPGSSTSFAATVTAQSGFTNSVTLGLAGAPANLGASFNPPTISGAGVSTLNLTASNAISPGSYLLSLTATSGGLWSTSSVTLIITNVAGVPGTLVWIGTNNWSVPLNWTNMTSAGNGPPGVANDVVFTNYAAAIANGTINNVVNSNSKIASLAFNHTNGFHTTQIAPGKTLTIAGINGLLVGTETDAGNLQLVTAKITGAGGTLDLTNSGASLIVRQGSVNSGGTLMATLDLSGLDTFRATVYQIQIGAYGPNARPAGTLYLARTNQIVVSSGAPGIVIGGQGGGSRNSGNGSFLYLGQQNTIFANGITVALHKQGNSSMLFNPAFANPTAYFRSPNGLDRVTSWIIGDSGSFTGTVNTTGTNDFTGGMVDALVNTLTLGKSSTGGGLGNPMGTLTFDGGTMDINTLQIGYQSPGGSLGNIAMGIVNVNGAANLIVNSGIELGHIPIGGANATTGTLTINGGTVTSGNCFGGGGISIINLNLGILNLQNGQITNVTTLNIGSPGLSGAAQVLNAGMVQSSNPILISSNGLLAGNVIVTTPSLILDGAISPGGDGTGSITNYGNASLRMGGRYQFDMSDASGEPGTGWDLISINGTLGITANSSNPFVIRLRSIDGGLNDPNPGAANFSALASQSWIIATAMGGITNFSADKFTVDASTFANNLAGGTFSVQTNDNALVLIFTAKSPPVIGDIVVIGGNLVFMGTSGSAGGICYVLTSTNLNTPVSIWTRLATNYFDVNGRFYFTNPISAGTPQRFYQLEIP
jgi:hypothetical protein